MGTHSRDRITARAVEAAETMHRHHTGEKVLVPGEIVAALVDLGNEVAASWGAYHAALAACPVVVSNTELAALYQSVADSVKALTLATWGKPHEPRRSEEGTEPVVPEPVEPVVSGAGTAEHLP